MIYAAFYVAAKAGYSSTKKLKVVRNKMNTKTIRVSTFVWGRLVALESYLLLHGKGKWDHSRMIEKLLDQTEEDLMDVIPVPEEKKEE